MNYQEMQDWASELAESEIGTSCVPIIEHIKIR